MPRIHPASETKALAAPERSGFTAAIQSGHSNGAVTEFRVAGHKDCRDQKFNQQIRLKRVKTRTFTLAAGALTLVAAGALTLQAATPKDELL